MGRNENLLAAIAKKQACTPVKSRVVKHEFFYFWSLIAQALFMLCKCISYELVYNAQSVQSWKLQLSLSTQPPLEFWNHFFSTLSLQCWTHAEYILFSNMEQQCHHPMPLFPIVWHMIILYLSSHLIVPDCNPHLRTACYYNEEFVEFQFCSFIPSCLLAMVLPWPLFWA